MSIDYVIVGIVVGWFALMIALVPRGAARARREENRRRLEVLTGEDTQRATIRGLRATPDHRPTAAREKAR